MFQEPSTPENVGFDKDLEKFNVEANFSQLKNFFLDFKEKYEINEQDINRLDLRKVLNDLIEKFPFIQKHIKESYEKYLKEEPKEIKSSIKPAKKLMEFLKNLNELKSLLNSLKTENENIKAFVHETLKNLIGSICEKTNEFFEKNNNEKQVLLKTMDDLRSENNRECVNLSKEIEDIQKEKNDLENLLKINEKEKINIAEEHKNLLEWKVKFTDEEASRKQEFENVQQEIFKLESLKKEHEKEILSIAEEQKFLIDLKSEKIQEEFLIKKERELLQQEKLQIEALRKTQEEERLFLADEQKRLDSIREIILMNEKLQKESLAAQNSSFSFQGLSEKPSPMPTDLQPLTNFELTTNRKKSEKKSRFLSNFDTPMKSLSEISESRKSQGRMLRQSIVEGLKFIHEKDENPAEYEKIKELEKRTSRELTNELVMPHLLENKTREKKKLKDYREEYKRKKLVKKDKINKEEDNKKTEKGFKQKYKTLRESSIKKMKEVLNKDIKLKKIT